MAYKEERNIVRVVILFVVHAIVVVTIAWFLAFGFGYSVVNYGQSMEPTMAPDETVILNRVSYHFTDPERFDIIAFTEDDNTLMTDEELDSESVSIKRIVGLPGESVYIADGHIYINGLKLQENLSFGGVSLAGIASEPIVLEENEYFVLGDNRAASEDSRFEKIGNIKRTEIIGKVWFRTRPIKQFGRIE